MLLHATVETSTVAMTGGCLRALGKMLCLTGLYTTEVDSACRYPARLFLSHHGNMERSDIAEHS